MPDTVEILGTYHNNEESIQQVERVIRDREPDVVAVELPPGTFTDGFEWSLSDALDPRTSVTLPALALQRFAFEGQLWQVDEMFVAAQTAADIEADVALIDRPFAESVDKVARNRVRDVFADLRAGWREISVHRESLADNGRAELLERDFWKIGAVASPYVKYGWHLWRHGATNLLDSNQREAAQDRFGPEASTTSLDRMRMFFPRMMATHIDERDACMAGHLRWLSDEVEDVLAIVAMGHVQGVAERLDGRQELAEERIQRPAYAERDEIRNHPVGLRDEDSEYAGSPS